MEGDFSWLWRNEDLSDFVCVVRPVLVRNPPEQDAEIVSEEFVAEEAAEEAAEEEPAEDKPRSSKRRRTTPAAAADATPSRPRSRSADAAATPGSRQQQPRQEEQPQPSPRLTRRQLQQQQQQQQARTHQQEPPSPQQQEPQRRQQRQDSQLPQLPLATPNARRSRRSSAPAPQQQQAAAQDVQQPADNAQQQQPAQHDAAVEQQPTGRVTRASSRKKQQAAASDSSKQQQDRGPGDGSATPAAAAAAAGPSRAAGRRQQQQQGPGSPADAAAAAAAGAQPQQQQPQEAVPGELRIPVHAVVLAGFSEYFKALICSWAGSLRNRTLTLDVGVDEAGAAQMMLEFMYTGRLPAAEPAELLKMVRLADQYQVTRFLAAASSSFESLPLAALSLDVVLEVFGLPQLMLDAPEMARVVSRARAKLLELFGDLEKVWACESLREEFIALPLPAVRCLLSSDATAVAAENTALVALTGWVEEGPAGRATTPAQRKELLGLIRLPFLTSSFIGDVLHCLPWVAESLDSKQLINAFQFAVASEATRQRLASYEFGPSAATPHFRAPRPASAVTRASFEWSIELSTIKRCVADALLWGKVVELCSPLHFFAGFWWQLLFNVERSPAPAEPPPDAAAGAAPPPPAVVEFVGVRCHANAGSHDYWPRVVRFKATIAALQTGFWEADYAYVKAIEGPIVDGVGLGYPGFFALPGQALDSEAAWSRFVRGGRVQLRCEVLDCE